MSTPWASSIASGLSPPGAGPLAHAHVSRLCAGVLLVSEAQIRRATLLCLRRGLLAEPAAAAALAAVLGGQVGSDIYSKTVNIDLVLYVYLQY